MHLTTITSVPTPLPPLQAKLLVAKFPNSITRSTFVMKAHGVLLMHKYNK